MKQAFRLSCAAAFFVLLTVASAAATFAQAVQDPFVAQITTSNRESFAGDISGDGRFVVIESTGDISTEKTQQRNNADGNREIFLFDYAQRRIFQITDTTSARVDTTKPAVSTTNPNDLSNVKVEVSNNQPVISHNGRWIAFMSNASTPGDFDGDANAASLVADGNQEIFIYLIPPVPAADLSSGADPVFTDLTAVTPNGGTFTRITDTPASRVPVPGSTTASPIVAFDNRDPAVDDDASVVAFVSTRNLLGGNADGSPEIYLYKRSPAPTALVQLTATTPAAKEIPFSENPSLSGDGSVIAFISNANLLSNNTDRNAEVFLGSFNGTTATVTRQVTQTSVPSGFTGVPLNILSPGRRLSRDGEYLLFESRVDLPGNGAIQNTTTVMLYDIAASTFKQVGPRASTSNALRFPTFTDYNQNTLEPATIIFASALNFTASGAVPQTTADGINPNQSTQIFSTPLNNPTTFTRLTNTPSVLGPSLQPYTSDTRERMAFSLERIELGGLNSDLLAEAFYLLVRPGTNVANATVSFFTGASERAVVATPTAPQVAGLAPGMLGIIRSTTPLAPSTQSVGPTAASEPKHRPSLPIELNGVSVSVNSAAAGLFFVSPGEIHFVVPPGLAANASTETYPVVINNNGSIIRTTLKVLTAQPDIFTQTDAFGSNRADVVTAATHTQEPFTVPVTLTIVLTGVRRITDNSQVTVRIGTTDIVGTTADTSPVKVSPTNTPGMDQIDVIVPASLAGAGDVPVIVTVTVGGTTFTSRPADTAPRIRIN